MGRNAQSLSGQVQPGAQPYKKGGLVFEKSKKDVEPKGMKEGSKKEEALDKKQMACGGRSKKK